VRHSRRLVDNRIRWKDQRILKTANQTRREGHAASKYNKSISINGTNRPTQRPRVRNVWRCHWLSKGRAKTKQVTSRPQAWRR